MKALPFKPVIIIDEANELMDWKKPGPKEPKLKRMLNFLVGISKQKKQVHVWLVTSDLYPS